MNNVAEYLLESVQKFPDKVAFCEEGKEITFKGLDRVARNLAARITHELNGKKNQPIAVFMEKGIDTITAFVGILYSGNYYSPIDVHSPEARIKLVMNILEPQIVIVNDVNNVKSIIEEDIWQNKKVIDLNDLQNVYMDFDVERAICNVLDIDPAYVLFTSGSTGVPKGVVVNHRAIIDYQEWLTDTFSFDEQTIFGNQAPLYFDNSILDIYQTLKNGATMVFIPEKYFIFQSKLIPFINEYKVNTIFWVPSALTGVANSGIMEKYQFEYLQKVLFCGEVMPVKQLNEWKKYYPDLLYANLYGPTEITDVCSYYIVDREFEDTDLLPIGYPCRNTDIIVLNEEDKMVKADEAGELCVRGCCLSNGYYKQPQKSEEVFVQNPLNTCYRDLIYRTGDIVKYNDLGELVYLCRKDSQIKYQGYRIELGEIDNAGYSIEGITQACALFDGEKIIFYASVKNELSEKNIYQQLKTRIPSYMMPKKIVILPELPLNSNGKIDRTYLKAKIKELV